MELHKRAELALEKRDKLLTESYNRIENKMKLLGSTGILRLLLTGEGYKIFCKKICSGWRGGLKMKEKGENFFKNWVKSHFLGHSLIRSIAAGGKN